MTQKIYLREQSRGEMNSDMKEGLFQIHKPNTVNSA